MTPDPAIATAADYADALITARRAKLVLGLILALILLIQLTLFLLVRFEVIHLPAAPTAASLADTLPATPAAIPPAAATLPATAPTLASGTASTGSTPAWLLDALQYLVDGSVFVGIVSGIVFSIVLLLIVNVMLVGRLIGVARLTSAYVWSIVLLVLLFPWQAFLANATFSNPELRVPGVLYNWHEFLTTADFGPSMPLEVQILKWVRFVVMPIVALIIVMVVHLKSNRGLKQALGEADVTGTDAGV